MNIVFVCQRGELELKACLLAWSLHQSAGKGINLFAAIPRHNDWDKLSPLTINLFTTLSVQLCYFTPSFGETYPIGNKIDALGLLPPDEPGAFLDSDIICLGELDWQHRWETADFLAKPADMATWGTVEQWERVYASRGMNLPTRRVRLTVSETLSLPYFNAGVVAAKKPYALAERWKSIAIELQQMDGLEPKYPWLDQISLPIAVHSLLESRWSLLSERYNFPAHERTLSDRSIGLCHYHWPHVIAREPRLHATLLSLLEQNPYIAPLYMASSSWAPLVKPRLPFINTLTEPERNFLITGIPRSGTSFVSRLLDSQNDFVVINEPAEIFEQLSNRKNADGIALFHAECRAQIIAGKPIENKVENGVIIEDTAIKDVRNYYHPDVDTVNFRLGSKNPLAYIAALDYLVDLNWPIIAMVRNPIDTLASWRNTFNHLKEARPSDLSIANPLYHGWSSRQREALYEIDGQNDESLRRVLLWRFLARVLIEKRDHLLLYRYEDVVENPGVMQQSLNERLRYTTTTRAIGSQYRQRLSDYDLNEFEMLNDLCFHELQELGYARA